MSLDPASDVSSNFEDVNFTDLPVSTPSPSTGTQPLTETTSAAAATHLTQSLELPPPALIAIIIAFGLLSGICTLFVVLHVRQRLRRDGPRKTVMEYITPLPIPPPAGEAWVSRLSVCLEDARPVRVMPALPERSWRREGRQARRDLATKSVFGLSNPPPYTLTSECNSYLVCHSTT
ncbi:hypothetical protein EXIGLDRAFT_766938 [Exidia glandulosa HHB12029]|uniref:Uncharacterized protein n=1 Tax=Exidia glandulosa HHB12029 TaxID=1314781 RepID=A0A165JCH9_EXIGL|nr:hypothetical protein EXIGLDRAFT_766938 [Exidia glandulosa HHB12029]